MMMGTLNYMAPEQVRGERADHRSDIFATGVVLYELLSGRKAFQGDSFAATLYKILQEVPEPLDRIDSSLPWQMIAIVERALAKPRDERYQHMGEMLRDLLTVKQTEQLSDHRQGIVGDSLGTQLATATADAWIVGQRPPSVLSGRRLVDSDVGRTATDHRGGFPPRTSMSRASESAPCQVTPVPAERRTGARRDAIVRSSSHCRRSRHRRRATTNSLAGAGKDRVSSQASTPRG
jgi:serine/threonine protein kinase